jgi:transcriptional regulator with XRE-family HTH domain
MAFVLTHAVHSSQNAGMTQQPESAGAVPEWTVGWRMQRALAYAGVSVQQMADDLDVNRATIGRWLSDRIMPRRVYVQQWALRTGVSFEWLCHGDAGPCGEHPGGTWQSRSNYMQSRYTILNAQSAAA